MATETEDFKGAFSVAKSGNFGYAESTFETFAFKAAFSTTECVDFRRAETRAGTGRFSEPAGAPKGTPAGVKDIKWDMACTRCGICSTSGRTLGTRAGDKGGERYVGGGGRRSEPVHVGNKSTAGIEAKSDGRGSMKRDLAYDQSATFSSLSWRRAGLGDLLPFPSWAPRAETWRPRGVCTCGLTTDAMGLSLGVGGDGRLATSVAATAVWLEAQDTGDAASSRRAGAVPDPDEDEEELEELIWSMEKLRAPASPGHTYLPPSGTKPADKSAAPSYSYDPYPPPSSSRAPAPTLNWTSIPQARSIQAPPTGASCPVNPKSSLNFWFCKQLKRCLQGSVPVWVEGRKRPALVEVVLEGEQNSGSGGDG
ncbi:hypothetical protein DFH08DRAFT_817496 [Mycena albidolilacea]|uniref:Uncharacterized protein n=1 Tax=Mycena albidolilacea TaxID=1033008 RepID=A0AAD7EH13_9AGAR|nr:hypothetical protein DFH08DRAFT_817496 [Mycena albidolilacea]